MTFLIPRVIAFLFCLGVFFIGRHWQKEEQKKREWRTQQMANLASSIAGLHSATQAMNPSETPRGLGRVQDQQVQSRYTH